MPQFGISVAISYTVISRISGSDCTHMRLHAHMHHTHETMQQRINSRVVTLTRLRSVNASETMRTAKESRESFMHISMTGCMHEILHAYFTAK